MLFESQENVVFRGGSNHVESFFFKIEKKRFDSGYDGNALLARDGSIDALFELHLSMVGESSVHWRISGMITWLFFQTEGKVFRGQWEVVFPSKDSQLSS